MDEAEVAKLEQGYRGWHDWRSILIIALIEDWRRMREREDAVFAKGYRAGYYDADERGITPFQSDVDEAHADWVRGGRKTHLDVDE